MAEKTITEKLLYIQQNLKSPKDIVNTFGGFNYRSVESILQNAKPYLKEMGCVILLDDEITLVGERYYVKATATLTDGANSISNHAYAREPLQKPKMDEPQVTGSCSSYARKYALNGLLAIDDTKDPDSYDDKGNFVEKRPATTAKKEYRETPKTEIVHNLDLKLLDEAKALKINLDNVAKYLKKDVKSLTDEELSKCIEQKKKALEARKSK